jgi:hypothetical protein
MKRSVVSAGSDIHALMTVWHDPSSLLANGGKC